MPATSTIVASIRVISNHRKWGPLFLRGLGTLRRHGGKGVINHVDTPRKAWYLAGPMTGIPGWNYGPFAEAARDLRDRGYQIVSPHEVQWSTPIQDCHWVAYLRHDLALLVTCKGIIVLPGWGTSRGARLELSTAIALEMPVRFWINGELVKCG